MQRFDVYDPSFHPSMHPGELITDFLWQETFIARLSFIYLFLFTFNFKHLCRKPRKWTFKSQLRFIMLISSRLFHFVFICLIFFSFCLLFAFLLTMGLKMTTIMKLFIWSLSFFKFLSIWSLRFLEVLSFEIHLCVVWNRVVCFIKTFSQFFFYINIKKLTVEEQSYLAWSPIKEH